MNFYQQNYFEEDIFSTDYAFLARTIYEKYKPSTVIEFGCGPGNLSTELARLNIAVDAIDGFSKPDFSGYNSVRFTSVDLNDHESISNYLIGKKYDLAICTEVAEHLLPSSSVHLIDCLTQSAPVVIFSAAVPQQNGHGHINCQSRLFWHKLFAKKGFQIVDSLRGILQSNERLAIWYRLNVIDYRSTADASLCNEDIINNLISSESYSSSLFYLKSTENEISKAYLNYPLVKMYFSARRSIKRILKRSND